MIFGMLPEKLPPWAARIRPGEFQSLIKNLQLQLRCGMSAQTSINDFIYQGSPQRVVFGSGTLPTVWDEAERLGVSRALVLSTEGGQWLADAVSKQLGSRCGAVFAGAKMHTPVSVTDEAMAVVERTSADGIVAIGGGSTTGLGKAIALRTDLPQIVVPTTYAGSESTDILGETRDGKKTTLRDRKVLPETIVYDVDLTLKLPADVSVTSGINAIAHGVEALYAHNGNPLISLMAEDGVRALSQALPVIKRDPRDGEARRNALYGAWLCGAVLATASMALHHKLCHVIGGSFDLPHAETHAVILPHAAAFNAPAAPGAMARLARALESENAVEGLFSLAETTGAPTALRDLGMSQNGIEKAADLAVIESYQNPRRFDRDAIVRLLDNAWHGRRPTQN